MKNKFLKPALIAIAFLFTFGGGFAFCKIIYPSSPPQTIRKVTGIGGIFFKCKDPKKIKAWYAKNLGLHTDAYGTVFEWRQATDSTRRGYTVWGPFNEKTKYFEPSVKDFMINYRVENLQALVDQLRADSVEILDTIEKYDYGKFVHILDIEGNKIELWEPDDVEYAKISGGITK
jgi:predicted enzyme related to lactoylglutathione lyase